CGGVLSAQGIPATAPDFFELKVRPLLASSCYSCHTNSALGGLRMDSREALRKGGGPGPGIVPGACRWWKATLGLPTRGARRGLPFHAVKTSGTIAGR